MRLFLPLVMLCLAVTNTEAQPQNQYSKFDVRHWGVVLDNENTPKETVQEKMQ